MSKFNLQAAKAVVEAVREAMKVADQIEPGYTRHASKLPSIIKQTSGWEVDPKELAQFEKVVDLLICSIFGVDGDGDRSIKYLFVDRKRDATVLPSFKVPNVRCMSNDEDKLWAALWAAEANLSIAQEQFNREFRIFHNARQDNAVRRNRINRAKACDNCKRTGFVRIGYKEAEAWHDDESVSTKVALWRRRHTDGPPTGHIDCPKCQPVEHPEEPGFDGETEDDEE